LHASALFTYYSLPYFFYKNMKFLRNRFFARRFRAGMRDTWLLLRQFRWPLLAFCLAIGGGGTLYYLLSLPTKDPVESVFEGMYQVLGLTFLQPIQDFPHAGVLQVFYFLMPLVGIGILAQGVAEFGVLFFNRRTRGKEWEMAIASTFRDHIIIVGLGHLGFRVARNLIQMGQEVVVVEMNPGTDLVVNTKALGIPVIQDDASRLPTLTEAGIGKARSIILCTQNDSLNLQIALKARKANPNIRVIVRIFDEDFAQALQEQFGFMVMSATSMAAPAFAAAGAGLDMTPPITLEGQPMSLARVSLDGSSQLVGRTVGELESRFDISIVWLKQNHVADYHPPADQCVEAGDLLAILGGPGEIHQFMQENRQVS
jgi:Trk K+ transport system NAD-binding subunit